MLTPDPYLVSRYEGSTALHRKVELELRQAQRKSVYSPVYLEELQNAVIVAYSRMKVFQKLAARSSLDAEQLKDVIQQKAQTRNKQGEEPASTTEVVDVVVFYGQVYVSMRHEIRLTAKSASYITARASVLSNRSVPNKPVTEDEAKELLDDIAATIRASSYEKLIRSQGGNGLRSDIRASIQGACYEHHSAYRSDDVITETFDLIVDVPLADLVTT